jgi:hypothetical protein
MSVTTVQLLQAASEIVGGPEALARALGIGETLLGRFMDDSLELPDTLLLKAVDIILADRQSRFPPLERTGDLSQGPEFAQNRGGGNGGAAKGGRAG